MTSPIGKIRKTESMEDFEFCDMDEDLHVNFPKSPIQTATGKLGSGIALIFSALCTITEEQGWVLIVPVRTFAMTAAATLAGSMIGGIPGMAVGLLTGAGISYWNSPNKPASADSKKRFTLRQIMDEMTVQQKCDLLKELVECLKQRNIRILVREIFKNEEVRKVALKILSNYLLQKMGINLLKPL